MQMDGIEYVSGRELDKQFARTWKRPSVFKTNSATVIEI